ncbi:MAG: hypothetical protein ABI390_06460 [Daejeonella sp.]
MNLKVDKALKISIEKFAENVQENGSELHANLKTVFNSEQTYLDKVAEMDQVIDEAPKFDALREVIFDLLLINFFTEDVQKLEEDYLDSDEWEDIEEETIDRGTELLNLLLYIKECEDENLEPELEDFLKEFLLVDEDEFQDEHRIYEDVIANQILVDSSIEEVARVSKSLPEFSELKELFYPMICFFREQNPSAQEMDAYKNNSASPAFDTAVYSLLVSYNQS